MAGLLFVLVAVVRLVCLFLGFACCLVLDRGGGLPCLLPWCFGCSLCVVVLYCLGAGAGGGGVALSLGV
jgi:hypothetical protein